MSKHVLCLGNKSPALRTALKSVALKSEGDCFLIIALTAKYAIGFVISDTNPSIYVAENFGTAKYPAVTITEKLVTLPKGLLRKLQGMVRKNLSAYVFQLEKYKDKTSPLVLQNIQMFLETI
jgi:hypothetical protein